MPKMTPSEAFVETLAANGVTEVFGIMGSAFMDADRAMSEMGPTQLNIPRDYFYGELDVDIPQPFRVDRGPGGEATLDEAAKLLAGAKFPVILAGGGVVMADAVAQCKALAEALGAPVVNSYLHNDSFPASHPLWCGPLGYHGSKAAMQIISKADVVLALGSRLGPFGTLPQYGIDYWPADAKIIQVDADHKMLGLVKGISVGICGDAGAAAHALTARLAGMQLACAGNRDARAATVAECKAAWEKELDEWQHETDAYSLDMIEQQRKEPGNWLHPRQALRELEKAMPAGARGVQQPPMGRGEKEPSRFLRPTIRRRRFGKPKFRRHRPRDGRRGRDRRPTR